MAKINKQPLESAPIPVMKPRQWNSYSPEDVKRWGVERFLGQVAPQEPISFPDFGFTEEENQRMDAILKEDKQSDDF
jgi:hypothetical protein